MLGLWQGCKLSPLPLNKVYTLMTHTEGFMIHFAYHSDNAVNQLTVERT